MVTTSGQIVQDSIFPGQSYAEGLTKIPMNLGPTQVGTPAVAQSTGGSNPQSMLVAQPNAVWYLVGFLVLLAAMKYATEHEKAKMDLGGIRIGVYNWLAATLMAGTGIVVLKVIFNKYPVKGVTQVVSAM